MAAGTIPKYADGNDTGWVAITMGTSVSAGDLEYRQIGALVQIRGSGIKLVNPLTTSYINIAQIPSAIRPTNGQNIAVSCGYDQIPVYCTVNNNGGIYIRKPEGQSSIPTTVEIRLSGVYFP